MKPLVLPTLHILLLLQLTNLVTSAAKARVSSTPNLRIEALDRTIWEGPIKSGPRYLTAVKGDGANLTNFCDGVEGGAPNASSFNTALDAFDEASKKSPGFNYTLWYNGDMTDFAIISLAGIGWDSEPHVTWDILWNWKFPNYGNGQWTSGCRQQVQTGDDVLWAAIKGDYATPVFLRVTPTTKTVKKGQSVLFTVTEGVEGRARPSATINGVKANSRGQIKIPFPKRGHFSFKAEEPGSVRSPLVKITVKD